MSDQGPCCVGWLSDQTTMLCWLIEWPNDHAVLVDWVTKRPCCVGWLSDQKTMLCWLQPPPPPPPPSPAACWSAPAWCPTHCVGVTFFLSASCLPNTLPSPVLVFFLPFFPLQPFCLPNPSSFRALVFPTLLPLLLFCLPNLSSLCSLLSPSPVFPL